MLRGFKEFIMRGNLVEIAVGLVIALSFAAVVEALVAVIMDIVGKAGGTPNFSSWNPGGISIGDFLTALISFLIVAAVVYFFVVSPYNALMARVNRGEEEPAAPAEDVALLMEIRDLLAAQRGVGTTATGGTTPY